MFGHTGLHGAYYDTFRIAVAETDPARRAALRQEANEALAAEVKARAADTLDKVLFELSSNMKNAYSRSDM